MIADKVRVSLQMRLSYLWLGALELSQRQHVLAAQAIIRLFV